MDNEPKKTQQIEGTETFYSPRTQTPPHFAHNSSNFIPPPPPPYVANPYEYDSFYSEPMTPPSPEVFVKQSKKRSRSILLSSIISIVGLFLVASVLFFGIHGLPWQQSQLANHSTAQTQVMPTPTPSIANPSNSSFVSPTVVKHYTAYQIVKKIKEAINIQNTSDTSNVSGNTGMVQFEVLDANGSSLYLFLGTYETKEEATNAMNYYAATSDGPAMQYQYNYCMMIYSPMPAHILSNVIQQVNEYCV